MHEDEEIISHIQSPGMYKYKYSQVSPNAYGEHSDRSALTQAYPFVVVQTKSKQTGLPSSDLQA